MHSIDSPVTAAPYSKPISDAGSVHSPTLRRGGMIATNEVLARVCIVDVYVALAGVTPHPTGPSTWRGPAPWRDGKGKTSVSLDNDRGLWRDFAADQGGGILDLVARVRGGGRRAALHWLADWAGVPHADSLRWTPEERRAWAAERREMERDSPAARLWLAEAIRFSDAILAGEKAALFDPTLPPADCEAIAVFTQRLARWQRIGDAELVSEYRSWRDHQPELTAAMVSSARIRELADKRVLWRLLEEMGRDAA